MSAFEQFSRQIIPSESFAVLQDFQPSSASAYLYGSSEEHRASAILAHMALRHIPSALLEDGESDTFTLTYEGSSYSVGLYHGGKQDSIWALLSAELIYLDITGLPHHIWAPLIASAIRSNQTIQVLYVEPKEYSRSEDKSHYDLSDDYEGISDLPGYAMLQPTGENFCYVPILGFEGARYSIATTMVDPPRNKSFPIIGLPGFRPEYPFEAYIANQRPLEATSDWVYGDMKYVDASCPFCLFYTLRDIATNYRGDILKVALLGTKPHALGAALYAITNYDNTQIIYDYPKRKSGRTVGIGRIYLYHISFFISLLAAPAE